MVEWFGAPNREIIKSEIMETILIHFKHKKENLLVFGRIPIFGSRVIIENHIFTSGATNILYINHLPHKIMLKMLCLYLLGQNCLHLTF